MTLSSPFINRPVMTVMLTVAAAVFGILAYLRLPVSDLPDVEYPVMQVSAVYPGASPEVMAANVASPLERQFLNVDGIELVTSTSRQGVTSMNLEFRLDTDIDLAAADVQQAINAAQGELPSDLPSPPSYEKTNPNDQPIIYIGVASNTMTEGQLYDTAFTQIAQRFQTIEGVSRVQIYGSKRAIRVQVDPALLRERGMTFEDVSRQLRDGTSKIGIGELEGETMTMSLQPQTQLETVAEYEQLVIAVRDGAPIRLGDIATVKESLDNEDRNLSYWSSRLPDLDASLVMAVFKEDDANTVATAQRLKALIPRLDEVLPDSIYIAPIYDRSVTIENSIQGVKITLLTAFVLVVVIIFLFLGRFKDTIIPVVAIPLSIFLTFIFMRLLGYSIDNLSLMAITLSIGFLIDDAVVFLENMVRRMQDYGEDAMTASQNGAMEISFTLVATSLSLVAVFIPLVFMSGLIGRLFEQFGYIIIVAVLMSTVVALTLTPMLCGRLLNRRKDQEKSFLEKLADKLEIFLLKLYSPVLSLFLRVPPVSALMCLACAVGFYLVALAIPKSFIPTGDSSFISGIFITQTGTAPERIQSMQEQIDEIIQSNPYVTNFVTVSGVAEFLQSNYGIGFVSIVNPEQRPGVGIEEVAGMINGEIAQNVPGAVPLFRGVPTLEINTGAANDRLGRYQFSMLSLNEEELYAGAQQLQGAMFGSDLFTSARGDLYLDNPELEVLPFREQMALLGLSSRDFSQVLRNAYGQDFSYQIKTKTLQYDVIVEAEPDNRRDPENLENIYFQSNFEQVFDYSQDGTASPEESLLPFNAIGRFNQSVGPVAVNHINNFSSVTVGFDLAPGVTLGEATDFIESTAAQVLPRDVETTFRGRALLFRETGQSFAWLLLLAGFVMYVILAILYESYIHPLTILVAIPVALFGGLGTLFLLNMELSLYSGIGLFMLMGIVQKNGILLVDFALMRQEEGLSPREAAHEASLERFRPILMTTISTVLGVLPIAIGIGADAEARIPLGWAIVGGLIFAQMVTLVMTPSLYLVFDALQRWLDKIPAFQRGERAAKGTGGSGESMKLKKVRGEA